MPRHAGDRNRTSPFAFTGNKFEFRAVGSDQSLAFPNVVLNAMVAESLRDFANSLRNRLRDKNNKGPDALKDVVLEMVAEIARECKDILFEGDNYAEEWHQEAERRGLLNLRTTVDALGHLTSEKNTQLFESFGILSSSELHARYEVALEQYEMAIDIEAKTLENIVRTQVLPAGFSYLNELTQTAAQTKGIGLHVKESVIPVVKTLNDTLSELVSAVDELTKLLNMHQETLAAEAMHKKDMIIPAMDKVREAADKLEGLVPENMWPLPNYGE
ncbi:MAG: glutamine synthetase type III, partial [Rhodothermaceae bacterium]|nr:glutamine synthetase type III [Rhodothermaceae bacterium]